MKNTLERRFKYLYSRRIDFAYRFHFLSYLLNSVYPNLHLYSLGAFWASFLLVEFLLLQGTIYWRIKLKQLIKANNSFSFINTIRRFMFLKKLNGVLIFVPLVLFVTDW